VSTDFALFGTNPHADAPGRWESLAAREEFPGVVHARQVHGNTIRLHRSPVSGLHLMSTDADGHASGAEGVLMAVTVADCVPVFLVDPLRRATAMIHAGWRSAAGGILEEGVRVLGDGVGSHPQDLHLHLGPSICGMCYEVGPEVHEAMGLTPPPEATPIDLRAILARRGVWEGIPMESISRSAFCTMCENDRFYSHRCGDGERQIGFLGIREPSSSDGRSGRG
jgi:YfiH family protein